MIKYFLSIIFILFFNQSVFANDTKLNCTFKDAYLGMENGSIKKLTPDMQEYQLLSNDEILTFNEKKKIFVGWPADKFDDETIKVTMYNDIKGPKATINFKKVWEVNRITGVFIKEIYTKIEGKETSWGVADSIRYNCTKATKKF